MRHTCYETQNKKTEPKPPSRRRTSASKLTVVRAHTHSSQSSSLWPAAGQPCSPKGRGSGRCPPLCCRGSAWPDPCPQMVNAPVVVRKIFARAEGRLA